MKEIYDRDTRKKFCPPNFWLISEINGHSNTLFLGKVEDQDNEYREILDKMPYVFSFEKRAFVLRYEIEKDK